MAKRSQSEVTVSESAALDDGNHDRSHARGGPIEKGEQFRVYRAGEKSDSSMQQNSRFGGRLLVMTVRSKGIHGM